MEALLIVEDGRKTNEAIFEYLRLEGYRIISGYDGFEVLQIFDRDSVDLVVLDIMFPSNIRAFGSVWNKAEERHLIFMHTALELEYEKFLTSLWRQMIWNRLFFPGSRPARPDPEIYFI